MLYVFLIIFQVAMTCLGIHDVHSNSPITFHVGIFLLIINPLGIGMNICNLMDRR